MGSRCQVLHWKVLKSCFSADVGSDRLCSGLLLMLMLLLLMAVVAVVEVADVAVEDLLVDSRGPAEREVSDLIKLNT